MATTEEIKSWLDRADAAEVKHSDPLRWEAAEAIATKIEAGKKANQLAKELGRSPSYVSRYKWVWKHYGPLAAEVRPTFRQCEDESKSEDKPGKRPYRKQVATSPRPPRRNTAPKAIERDGTTEQISQEKNSPASPNWASAAPQLTTAFALTEADPELIADLVPEDHAGDITHWVDTIALWVERFSKALERRCGMEPESDDPVPPELIPR